MSETGVPRRRAPAAAAKQAVYGCTREAIVTRKLPPGTKLTEDAIADAFDCGRGAVRWALARLHDEGLVSLIPHRGAFVAQPAADEAKHLFGARRILEGGIVRCLCQFHRDEGCQPLIACAEAEDRARLSGDAAAALRLSGDFHLVMARLTGNPVVETMLRELVSRTILAISTHQRTDTSGCRTHEHWRLIELIRHGDIDAAAREIDAHLAALEEGLDLSPRPALSTGLREILSAARHARGA